jgi:hypothetical protein
MMRAGLIVLVASICIFGCAKPQPTAQPQPAPSDQRAGFARNQWQIRPFGESVAAIVRADNDDLLLFSCTESVNMVAVALIPADQSALSDEQNAILAFDGGAPVEPILTGLKHSTGHVSFSVTDIQPGFRTVMDKLMSFHMLDITIMQSGSVLSRRSFTLNGAAQAIAKVARRCGQ